MIPPHRTVTSMSTYRYIKALPAGSAVTVDTVPRDPVFDDLSRRREGVDKAEWDGLIVYDPETREYTRTSARSKGSSRTHIEKVLQAASETDRPFTAAELAATLRGNRHAETKACEVSMILVREDWPTVSTEPVITFAPGREADR